MAVLTRLRYPNAWIRFMLAFRGWFGGRSSRASTRLCGMDRQCLSPQLCDPPHRITHLEKVCDICRSLAVNGWVGDQLVGYLLDGRIQLINGSHRWAAAKELGIHIPVVVVSYAYVQDIWGDLDKWQQLLELGRQR